MSKYSILIIDDQKNWRELLVELLDRQFEVKSAESYEAALETIQAQRPPFHVVVTDMRLNDEDADNTDGLRLIEYLNGMGDETNTIVLTGYATIDTAKRALSNLAAYDYLEKYPSDGLQFNYKKFQQTVYQAAQASEKRRTHGFTDISRNILVIDKERGEIIKDILGKDGYQVTVLQIGPDLEDRVHEINQNYFLVFVSESASSVTLLDDLRRAYPDARIIILTSKNVEEILNAMREYPVLTALYTPSEKEVEPQRLRELVHSALSAQARKHILIEIASDSSSLEQVVPNGADLMVGVTYRVILSIQDAQEKGALPISLLPSEKNREKIRLHLFVHAEKMKVEPGVDMYWDIPFSNKRPGRLEFALIPQEQGNSTLTIEFEQYKYQWLGRMSMNLTVSK